MIGRCKNFKHSANDFHYILPIFIFQCIFLQFQVTSLLARKDIDIITPFDYKLYKEDDVVLRIFVRKPT